MTKRNAKTRSEPEACVYFAPEGNIQDRMRYMFDGTVAECSQYIREEIEEDYGTFEDEAGNTCFYEAAWNGCGVYVLVTF